MSQLTLARCFTCIVLAVSIEALAGVDQDWKKAKQTDSAEGYATFVEKYPKSKYSGEAAAALKQSRLIFVRRSHDAGAMEIFIKLYPEGDETGEIRRRLAALREAQANEAADRQKTMEQPASPDKWGAIKRLRWWAILGLAVNALVLLFVVLIGIETYKSADTKASPGQARGCLWGALTLTAIAGILWSVKLGIAPDTEGMTTFQILSSLFGIPLGLIMFFAGMFANTPEEDRRDAARKAEMAPIMEKLADHEAVERQLREKSGGARGFSDPHAQKALLYLRRDSERIISTLSRHQTKSDLLNAFSTLASTLSVHSQDQAGVCRGIVDSGFTLSETQLFVLRDDFLRNARAFLSSTSNAV